MNSVNDRPVLPGRFFILIILPFMFDSLKKSRAYSVFTVILKLLPVAAVCFLYVHYFIPQSFGYFTTDPRKPLINIYKVNNGIAEKQPVILNNLNYGMGISRKGRVLFNSSKRLAGIAKNLQWKILPVDSINFITQNGDYIPLHIPQEKKFFSGKILVTSRNQPRGVTSSQQGGIDTNTRYVLIDIK